MHSSSIAAIVISTIGLVACSKHLALALPPGVPVQVVELGGSGSYELPTTSEAYGKLAAWVALNQSGWSTYYATTPGMGIIVRAGTFHVQFVEHNVLAVTSNGVFTKSATLSEYSYLRR